ncbi:MAG: hypothetical protein ABI954_04800 [Pyrinomonadaceae bacterium]
MNDSELALKFADCTLSAVDFNHRNHVRLAWIYLHESEPLDALARFSENLKKFAASLGKANLYHETMTFAYFFLIHERIRRGGESQTWAAFVAANPDLLTGHKGILTKYYRSETIASDFARNVFVLPDKIIGSNYNAE